MCWKMTLPLPKCLYNLGFQTSAVTGSKWLSSPLGSRHRCQQGLIWFAGMGHCVLSGSSIICCCCRLLYFVHLGIGRGFPKTHPLAYLRVSVLGSYCPSSSALPLSPEPLQPLTPAFGSLKIMQGGIGYLLIHLFTHILTACWWTDTMPGTRLSWLTRDSMHSALSQRPVHSLMVEIQHCILSALVCCSGLTTPQFPSCGLSVLKDLATKISDDGRTISLLS